MEPGHFPRTVWPRALALTGFLIAVSVILLGAKGPLVIAAAASVLLVSRSLGVRLLSYPALPFGRNAFSRIGSITVIHSHHRPHERSCHEFCIAGKYFCGGCCGLGIGTISSLMLAAFFALDLLTLPTEYITVLVSLMCYIPTLYLVFVRDIVGRTSRALAYGLLPIAGWLGLLRLHASYHSPLMNILGLLAIAVAWWCGAAVYWRLRQQREGR